MSKSMWVWIAVGMSCLLLSMQLLFGTQSLHTEGHLPLLMVLLMSEFGFVLCCIGGYIASDILKKQGITSKMLLGLTLCAVFAMVFLWRIILLYPATGAAA